MITNAIWFKGIWAEPFVERNTHPASFRSMDGTSVQTPMMQRTVASARYAAFRQDGSEFPTPEKIPYDTRDEPDNSKLYPGPGGFQVAELPYRGGELAMMIVLPHSADGLANLEGALEGGKLATWASRLASRKVAVLLPKFRLEQRLDLVAALRSMGMKRAFVDPGSGQGAQFGGMTHGSNPGDALYVGAVVHKAFVDVNEQGTEAAAATGVEMERTMVVLQPMRDFVPTFRADRPFLFLIRDVRTGAILFMGRLATPGAPESH